MVAAIFWTLFAGDTKARQMDGNKTKQVDTAAASITGAASGAVNGNASENNKTSEPSERERMLLDRIEKLEHRLADLETRNSPKAAETALANGTGAGPSAVARSGESKASGAGAAPPGTSGLSDVNRDSTPQAESQLAPSTTRAAKAEPFAFGDFTWLTGNPRTKDSPINTEVFTGEIR